MGILHFCDKRVYLLQNIEIRKILLQGFNILNPCRKFFEFSILKTMYSLEQLTQCNVQSGGELFWCLQSCALSIYIFKAQI
jgi:hypothetical protein